MKFRLPQIYRYIKVFSLFIIVSGLALHSPKGVAELSAISTLDAMLKGRGGQLKLQLQLFVIFTTPVEGREVELVRDGKISNLLKQHLEYQHELEQSGVMFAAGPIYSDDLTWRGEGLVIVRADSLEDARRIAEADPIHTSGIRTFTVRPWLVAEGGFSMQVTFSDLQYKLE